MPSPRTVDEIRHRVDAGYPATFVIPDELMGFWMQHVEDAQFLLAENKRLRHGAIRLLNAMSRMGNRGWLSVNVREAENALGRVKSSETSFHERAPNPH